jgi:hypothetical protein
MRQALPATFDEVMRYTKSLPPLAAEAIADLAKLAKLDVSKYSEADVRAEIIDPVLKVLGYQKETDFSVKREKHLKILGRDVYIDYSVMLFEENFWIIEAKKVKRKKLRFIEKEVLQALQYASHPEINAALLVLCDGRLFEIYDREESLNEPVARVEVKKLAEDFNILRAFLSPWQAWFFQKRRVLRLIDKVLDHEINMQRLEEFKYDVNRRLIDKRAVVMRNCQNLSDWKDDHQKSIERLKAADTRELVDLHFFLGHSSGEMEVISQELVKRAKPGAFEIFYSIFPDEPRDANDKYWMSALHFLLSLESSGKEISWLPAFLRLTSGKDNLSEATKNLIAYCLKTFNGDMPRKCILQYSACIRRITKILMLRFPGMQDAGKLRHLIVRRTVGELDIVQFLSSPEGHNLRMLDEAQYHATARFCQDCTDERENFKFDLAKKKLKDLWREEQQLLGDGKEYRLALKAENLGEILPTEASWVVYDSLGHACLCVIAHYPKWVDFVMEHHRTDVERIARHGSWQAREFLGIDINVNTSYPSISLIECTTHFFDGDLQLCHSLIKGYGYERSIQLEPMEDNDSKFP